MKKIEKGKKYRNIHTGKVCTVTQKNFSTIGYHYVGDPEHKYPNYVHYETFMKNWVEEDECEK